MTSHMRLARTTRLGKSPNKSAHQMDIAVDGTTVPVTVLPKPAIVLEGLDELVDRFFEHCDETDGDAPPNAVYVATLERNLVDTFEGQQVRLPPDFVQLHWAKDLQGVAVPVMSEAELRACAWQNHLETLIDHTSGVGGPMNVVFAALECTRSGRRAQLQAVPNAPDHSMVWFAA